MRSCHLCITALIVFGFWGSPSLQAGKIAITTIPANAKIVVVDASNTKTFGTLGTGHADVKVKGKTIMFVRAELAGFVHTEPIRLTRKSPKTVTLVVKDWRVTVTGKPADADIVINGTVRGKGTVDVVVPRGEKLLAELKKPGFRPVKLLPVPENKPGSSPPVKVDLALQDWQFTVNNSDKVDLFQNGVLVKGPIIVALNQKVVVRMEKAGFAAKEVTFENRANKRPPGPLVNLKFDRMLVLVTSRTPGAQITTIPAQPPSSVGTKSVAIDRDTCVEVRVTLPGHEIITRRYCFLDGEARPPIKDIIPALRPAVQIRVTRPMGTRIFVDDVQVGTQTATVPLPDNVSSTCYSLRIEKEGFVTLEELRCDNTPLLQRELRDRVLPISVSPPTADIIVDGRKIGTGRGDVVIRDQQKVSVRGRKTGFVSSTPIEFENKQGVLSPPGAPSIQLLEDQAFTDTIEASDQANKNFTIEVNPKKDNDTAWKLLSLIVLNVFDVLEVTDKDTGYIRSAWEISDFGKTQIRTRIIVKLGDIDPLKYVIKLVSEHGEKPPANAPLGTKIKFTEFPRLLPKYKDIINEITFRLR